MKGACGRVAKGILLLSWWLPCLLNSQPIKYQLLPLSFAPGSAALAASDSPIMDSLAAFLQKSGARIEIGGHTDNLGTSTQNEELSRVRAQAISDYLQTKHKIPLTQLSVKGYGPGQPIATNRTPAGRAKNNRIEITILSDIPSAALKPLRGVIRVRKAGLTDWREVQTTQRVSVMDWIETDSAGYCTLIFDRGGMVRVRPRTVLLCEEILPDRAGLWSEGGSCRIDNHSAGESKTQLTITTAATRVTSRSCDGFMVIQPNYLDAVSVWRGAVTVQDRLEGPVLDVAAGYGVRGRVGSALEPACVLPQTPVVNSVSGQDTIWFEPGKPVKFILRYSKPDTVSARILLSRDKDQQDVIAEIDTADDSLDYTAYAVDAVFASISAVNAAGLVSPRTPVRLICVARKTTGPKLVINRQTVETEDGKKVLRIDGMTDPLSKLAVNQDNIKIPDDGSFSMMIRLKPGTSRITLTATNRWGHATKRIINLTAGFRRQAMVFAGPSYLSGSGFNTSRIGLIYGASLATRLPNKLAFGLFAGSGKIRCRTTDWEPDGEHYQTTFMIGGLNLTYGLNPDAPVVFQAGIEAGLMYWKSYFDDELREWAFSPYGGLNAGATISLSERIGVAATAGAGYLRNKDKFNLGAQGTKYFLPTGRLGLVFGF